MERFIEVFGINYKLLIAQLINFTVLVLVLGKFVYKPIIKALDNRRKKIEEGVEFSDKAKKELAGVEVMKTEEMKKAEIRGQEVIKKAEADANRVGADILSGAEKDKERILNTGKTILLEQKATMEKNFYQGAAGVVKEALAKVLGKGDFATEDDALIAETLKEVKVK
jgi:F-type H+-transporting ATPase subunit b